MINELNVYNTTSIHDESSVLAGPNDHSNQQTLDYAAQYIMQPKWNDTNLTMSWLRLSDMVPRSYSHQLQLLGKFIKWDCNGQK